MTQSVTIEQAMQQALWYFRGGYYNEAESIALQILKQVPQHAEALHLMALLLHRVGKHDDALKLLKRSIEANPKSAAVHHSMNGVLCALGRFDEAAASCRKAMEAGGENAEVYAALANALASGGKLEEAAEAETSAVRLMPDAPELHTNLGIVLSRIGKLDEAIAECREAVRLAPEAGVLYYNLGRAIAEKGVFAEALASFEKAMELDPEMAEAHMNRGVMLLALGRWEEGFKEYDWRGRVRGFPMRQYKEPLWDGAELNGRSILLHWEQGFGDTIQFIRYATLVEKRGGKVIVSCQEELERLLQPLKGIAEVALKGLSPPPHEVHCPLMSLPRVFGTTPPTIPSDFPYIQADANRVAAWAKKLPQRPGRYKVGLAWAGRPTHLNDRNRSMDLKTLAPLSAAGAATFYSLQRRSAKQTAAVAPEGMDLVDMADELHDFNEAAALIANMDLVITVDTAAAHLAGAMSKPVWTMLPLVADWRWMERGETTPWYPTMRLYRQEARSEWGSVIARVARDLGEEVRKSRPSLWKRLLGRK